MEAQKYDPTLPNIELNQSQKDQFKEKGYLILKDVINEDFITELQTELDKILLKQYQTNIPPDKSSKTPQNCHMSSKHVIHLINIWKSSYKFSYLVKSQTLSKLICSLYNWPGCRIAEDQVWIKPSGSVGLTYHRDSVYFDFLPQQIITVWIALDHMKDELGPLEYVEGSHLWQVNSQLGAARVFYDDNNNDQLKQNLKATAYSNGIDHHQLVYQKVIVQKGGLGIHDGRCFHGSGPNTSNQVRRAIGIHFISSQATFNHMVKLKPIWQKFKQQGSYQLQDQFFPITYQSQHIIL